jgi:hypothetical protein
MRASLTDIGADYDRQRTDLAKEARNRVGLIQSKSGVSSVIIYYLSIIIYVGYIGVGTVIIDKW